MILYCAFCAEKPVLKNSCFCSPFCSRLASLTVGNYPPCNKDVLRSGLTIGEERLIENEMTRPYDPELDGPFPDEPETKT